MTTLANKITGSVRTETGKGAARRARRSGNIPGVVYGHGIDNTSVNLPAHEVFLAVKDSANALIELSLDGQEHLTLVKDVQRHPVRRDILHVDLMAISRDEKVEVEVPVTVTGELAGGLVHAQDLFAIEVEAPALAIPEEITVSIQGLGEGDAIHVSDVAFPDGVTPKADPEEIVVSVMAAAEEPETEQVIEGEAEAQAAEEPAADAE